MHVSLLSGQRLTQMLDQQLKVTGQGERAALWSWTAPTPQPLYIARSHEVPLGPKLSGVRSPFSTKPSVRSSTRYVTVVRAEEGAGDTPVLEGQETSEPQNPSCPSSSPTNHYTGKGWRELGALCPVSVF